MLRPSREMLQQKQGIFNSSSPHCNHQAYLAADALCCSFPLSLPPPKLGIQLAGSSEAAFDNLKTEPCN
ncbi:hypothetical protein O3P69_016812 [Scylla paramamosain]|uniref:Uncharacterized protein n=1 Tax=Scylla paramamosain TaxID=85552 RepID=A0AAW0T0H1_SCYPA